MVGSCCGVLEQCDLVFRGGLLFNGYGFNASRLDWIGRLEVGIASDCACILCNVGAQLYRARSLRDWVYSLTA